MKCRLCGSEKLVEFLDLGMQPLSNAYMSDPYGPETFYPLRVSVCEECFLVQLPALATAESIFSQYNYLSGMSATWRGHCEAYARQMARDFRLCTTDQVVEIASNDGTLLKCFQKRGINVLGIEPAKNIAAQANRDGIKTTPEFFGVDLAERLIKTGAKPRFIIANNVLAHVPDLNDFVAGLKILLPTDGVITIEVPHLANLIKKLQFDTIYQEHFSYFSITTIQKVMDAHGLCVTVVEPIPTHGGSIRVFVRHAKEFRRSPNLSYSEPGLQCLDTYQNFGAAVRELKFEIRSYLESCYVDALKVAAYGAAAKGNTLLNFCGIRSDSISYVVDKNPLKIGKYLPGSRIPIFHPDHLTETEPNRIVILPWNIKDEVIAQLRAIVTWPCTAVTFIPTVKETRLI